MMNGNDLHVKSLNQFEFSMKNINNSSIITENDDSCIDLLEMINMDDNSSSVLSNPCNLNQGSSSIIIDDVTLKEDDKFYNEIMLALEKKDFQRIATLALSQSHGSQNIGVILNETMQAIEKSSNNTMDSNIIEKITSMIRSQPKSSSSVLRATVAPIRNESIVSSSTSNISNYSLVSNISGPKTSSHVSRYPPSHDMSEQDWQALFSSEIKPQGTRSLPATPPVPQVPSRPLSSSCLPPVNTVDTGRLSCTDIDSAFSYKPQQQQPGLCGPMSFVQLSHNQQPGQMLIQNGGYSQGNQYQSSFISNNGIMCIVTPSMTGGGVGGESHYPGNIGHSPFMIPQNMLMSQSCLPQTDSSSKTSSITSTAVTGSTTVPCGISSLPRILPKPIAPKIHQQFVTTLHQHQQQQQVLSSSSSSFKRPATNRKSSARPAKSASKSGCRASNKCKDNVMMAWEIAEQSLACEDLPVPVQHHIDTVAMVTEDSENIYGCFEDLFEDLNGSYCCVPSIAVTMTAMTVVEEMVMEGAVCEDDRVPLCRRLSYRMLAAPLSRPLLTWTPRTFRATIVVVVATSPHFHLQHHHLHHNNHSNESPWLSSIGHSNNNNSSSRMVELLCAHLGRQSVGLLSPLLKCLLPEQGPLSVSTGTTATTQAEQEDLLTEEDLSPVKRDPSHLANLDRLLESCQDDLGNVISRGVTQRQQQRLPFQRPRELRHHQLHHHQLHHHRDYYHPEEEVEDEEDRCIRELFNNINNESIHSYNRSEDVGDNAMGTSWLKTKNSSKQKSGQRWTVRGTAVRSTHTLEVPLTSVAGHSDSAMVVPPLRLLVKKSNYQWKVKSPLQAATKNDSNSAYRRKMRKIVSDNRAKRGDVSSAVEVPPRLSSGLLKIRIQLPKMEDRLTTETMCEGGCGAERRPPEKKPKRKKSGRSGGMEATESETVKAGDSDTKRIFCTRKEERRSSVLHSCSPSKQHTRHSPPIKKKKKRRRSRVSVKDTEAVSCLETAAKEPRDHPPLIMKLRRPEETSQDTTSDTIKLLIRRNGQATYQSQIPQQASASEEQQYEYSPTVILQAPPSTVRSRPPQPLVQFSPTHSSSSGSDLTVTHNEISSLLQRQEQREPLSCAATAAVAADPSNLSAGSRVMLPVPYLVGSDPSVFMDPNEIELIVVKNSRYKKMSSAPLLPAAVKNAIIPSPVTATTATEQHADSNYVFVPGCFIDQQDKIGGAASNMPWNRTSPSMPVLAPQEPFIANTSTTTTNVSVTMTTTTTGNSTITKSSLYCPYSQSNQPYSDPPDRIQQSPLCMTTTNTNNPQYSSSSQAADLSPTDPIKSPYRHTNYHYQSAYNSSCYLGDPNSQSMLLPTSSSNKNQMQSPSLPLQTNDSSARLSQLENYSYFHNTGQLALQSLASADSSIFSVPSSNYQAISETQPSKSSSKRSSSNRNNQSCDQALTKKRIKDPLSLSALSMYSNHSDLYNAATHYPGFDYYDSLLGNMETMKLYEQYSLIGNICPQNMPWTAMAEYCKQAQGLTPQGSSVTPHSVDIPGVLQSSNPLQAIDYSGTYNPYVMSQPYSMYSSFGIPK